MDFAINMSSVVKRYGSMTALDNLSLSVAPGEIYGFIGPNGAGKSTTIRLLLGMIRKQSGEVSVLGLDPSHDDVAIKRQTGYVSSEAFLYPDMLVRDLFRFTASFHKIDPKARAKELQDILQIDPNKRFEELSFGNRKKVAIACALLHSPRLIILDEPSNGLDPVIRANLYELLQSERDRGATIFFSSHVLAEVQKVCTRIGLIKQGKLIREATNQDFTQIGYRRVTVETASEMDFKQLPGVSGLERADKRYQFMYSGDPDHLIRLLATISLDSIHIEEPDLESVFMHYYNHHQN